MGDEETKMTTDQLLRVLQGALQAVATGDVPTGVKNKAGELAGEVLDKLKTQVAK